MLESAQSSRSAGCPGGWTQRSLAHADAFPLGDTKPTMSQRMALYMQDRHPISYELEMAQYAESSLEKWQQP